MAFKPPVDLLIPKYLKSSLDQDQYRGRDPKETILQRIRARYAGDLPRPVKSFIKFFSNHEERVKSGAVLPNRILLYGLPGGGKTHLVEVLASELEVPLVSVPTALFADKMLGDSAKRVIKAFAAVTNLKTRAILFLDEVETIASQTHSGTHTENLAIMGALLISYNEIIENPNVFVFSATNADISGELILDSTVSTSEGGNTNTQSGTNDGRQYGINGSVNSSVNASMNAGIVGFGGGTVGASGGISVGGSYNWSNGTSTSTSTGTSTGTSTSVRRPGAVLLHDAFLSRHPYKCLIKRPSGECLVEMIMIFFGKQRLDLNFANQDLARAIVAQIPRNADIRDVSAVVALAKSYQSDDEANRCICFYFNEAFKDLEAFKTKNINCVHIPVPVNAPAPAEVPVPVIVPEPIPVATPRPEPVIAAIPVPVPAVRREATVPVSNGTICLIS